MSEGSEMIFIVSAIFPASEQTGAAFIIDHQTWAIGGIEVLFGLAEFEARITELAKRGQPYVATHFQVLADQIQTCERMMLQHRQKQMQAAETDHQGVH